MSIRNQLFSFGLLCGTVLLSAIAQDAAAQSSTTGAIQGVVTDGATGEKLVGVTVVATSASLPQAQTEITDENGFFKISSLPPGSYVITFYYGDAEYQESGVPVGIQKVTPVYKKIGVKIAQTIEYKGAALIDPTQTNQGITIDKNMLEKVPVPGRTFESALGAAAGSQGDALGVAFSGSSSLENQYVVDGVNTTGLQFGTAGSPVINDFIEEIEVITGGYNAEYGRSTGAQVNVVTKSGSNDFKGSVFGFYSPGQLRAKLERTPSQVSSIDSVGDLAYQLDAGFEIGGPIIRDKLWFWVGFSAPFTGVDLKRTVSRHRDCQTPLPGRQLSGCDPEANADQRPDRDPVTGLYVTDPVETREFQTTTQQFGGAAKITFGPSPQHQGQLAAQGSWSSADIQGIQGNVDTSRYEQQGMLIDSALKWNSKFNDDKTEVEVKLGWHYADGRTDAADRALNNVPLEIMSDTSLSQLAVVGNESDTVRSMCRDDANSAVDPYPGIDNCPISDESGYVVGGIGSFGPSSEQRKEVSLGVTHRMKLLGSHEWKLGGDYQINNMTNSRLVSGGAFFTNVLGDEAIIANRWVQLAPNGSTDPRFDNMCRRPDPDDSSGLGNGTQTLACDYLAGEEGYPGTTVEGETQNWSAYLRDSWQIRPNFTFNFGLRYEEQRLLYAKALRNTTDSLTGNQLGTNAMVLRGMFAPRVGILYDWTKEGRSKIYTSWGRYYESIPMQINDRSFGGEVLYRQIFDSSQCGSVDAQLGAQRGVGCLADPDAQANQREDMLGASGVLIQPGIKAQYLDELLAGVEYEIVDDMKLGISLQNRRLGRVIEDVSPDGAATYIIANPGEWDESEAAALEAQIEATDDPARKAKLQRQLDGYRYIANFDKPTRDYNALQFTATRRFSKNFYLQGSYTYSQIRGNYPGLISYDNGQVDPNISSQYDLIELLANRYGSLPQERPHYIKVDGYYTFDFKKAGSMTFGARYRASSGVPISALGGHSVYGADESFVLPRGVVGRTPFSNALDLQLVYGKDLPAGMKIEFVAGAQNVWNTQSTASVDQSYAPRLGDNNVANDASPISGGTYDDLIWAKAVNDGVPTIKPLERNPNFKQPVARYSPFQMDFGFRLKF